MKRVVEEISTNGRWNESWLEGMRAEAARYGSRFNGRADDAVTPAGVLASLGEDRCLRLYTSMTDVACNGGDPYAFARHRDALTSEVERLGRPSGGHRR